MMSLSTSRQQFLAYETQEPEDIQYGRRGGMFITTCVCLSLTILAVIIAVLVGVIVYFVTYFKLSHKPVDFWDDTEPFGQITPSANLRLPSYIVPSFYRLKLKADLETSTFSGDVSITIKSSKRVKEIILHSKDLSIKNNTKLTEQVYEKLETIPSRNKRDVSTPEELNSTTNLQPNSTLAPNIINATTEFATDLNATETILNSTQPTTEYSSELPIDTQVIHSNVRNVKIISVEQGTGERLILMLASPLTPGADYTLELSFEGKIANSLTGFYKSTYINSHNEVEQLGVTQFEPTSARAAFPCFDEPAFKAKFEISIAHRDNVTVLSNMKVATQEVIPEQPGWQWTHFERSVNMSTYLVAYTLSDFKSLETNYTSKDNVTKPIRVWARPDLLSKANYALNITPKLLRYYEEVFGYPYVLDKLDLVAIPDFSNGAMENWGLITFRETGLLFDETNSVPRDKQNVAIDIAHELAHQWFGNLVTMKWWTDLWLNEGFATYVEYLGVNHVEPDWHMFDEFTRDKMDLLRTDALKNTSPVSRRVVDATEISQKFDEISYAKGASLIRMLNHTITGDLFHKGLVIYLNEWKYSNAEETDLWEAMSKATESDPQLKELSVVDFMNSWTKQTGYPVVNVIRDYAGGQVTFEQKLFTSSKTPYKETVDQLWHIPISYTTLDAPVSEWTTKPKLWLKDRTMNVNIPLKDSQALYVNLGSIGYYRVNYDQRNWGLLADALKSNNVKSAITRAQLLDDAFNLAKTSQLDYSYALGLTTYVINGEESRMVWETLLNTIGFLKYNLMATPGFIYFQDYVRKLLEKQLQQMKYGLSSPKDYNEALLVESLVGLECAMESPRCLDWARAEFQKWTSQADLNNNPIPNHFRSLVYNMALRYGGRREFEFLWNVFKNSTDPNVKSLIITSLPSIRDESLIAMLLEKSITEIPKQYAVSVWSVEPPLGTRVAQKFLIDNFDRVYAKFTEMDTFIFGSVLSGAFGFITNENTLNELKSFALQHKEQLLPMSQTLQKLVDTATFKIDWHENHEAEVSRWFKDFVTEKSTTQTEATPPAVTDYTHPSTNYATTSNGTNLSTSTLQNETTDSSNSTVNKTQIDATSTTSP